MNQDKIEKLAQTPRPIDETLRKIRARPFFFLRGANRKWEQHMTTSPLVFVYVVQANEALFEEGEGNTAPAVLLYTTDPAHCRDAQWLQDLGQRVSALKSSGTRDPKANELGAYLAAEESTFDLPVPDSLTGGVAARIKTTWVSTDELPGECIGPDRLIPALAFPDGDLAPIPGELYS
jgi:hypothetical protein